MKEALAADLGSEILALDEVSGGDINDAFRARLADGRVVFVKTHAAAPPGMFMSEAHGLDWLRAHTPLVIPDVLAQGDDYLALQWLELDGNPRSVAAELGRGLAKLHASRPPKFGLDFPNYLATLEQDNVAEADWPTFYVERRLRPLCERARAKQAMPDVRAQLDALLAKRDRFGPDERPARLHGDLWWGNVAATGGKPVLIDPAVYGGHREIDLAMLALFGGLPDELVAAYDEVYPLADGWRDRIELCQLYPLAAHACLFGGSYGAQVARTLARLV